METAQTSEKRNYPENTVARKTINNFIEEYEYFLKEYLFRLFGVAKDTVLTPDFRSGKDEVPRVSLEDGWVIFSAYKKTYFKMPVSDMPLADTDSISLAISIIDAFLICSEYKSAKEDDRRNRYRSQIARDQAYKLAIQDGIGQWIFGVTDAETLGKFFDLLEKWSVKTYEGKHVTLGFLVNPSSQAKVILPFNELLSFLDDDSSAVLSDCIHSVLEVDKNCNFVGYHSITENLTDLPACTLNENVPIRFVQAVQRFLPEKNNEDGSDKVGVFLLSNGDILLVKNGTTRFVKRNLRWLNLSESAFAYSLRTVTSPTLTNPDLDAVHKQILKSVYASVLDVSFSHTGGIIAIVDPECIGKLMEEKILSPYDNLQISDEDAYNLVTTYDLNVPPNEKVTRRKLLKQLVTDRSFYKLDRKLRCELIALDGACIIDSQYGIVYSFGAIIQNDSGSATGGRSAATKKLSQYGAAIKVSTDGYIDVFINKEPVYSIK